MDQLIIFICFVVVLLLVIVYESQTRRAEKQAQADLARLLEAREPKAQESQEVDPELAFNMWADSVCAERPNEQEVADFDRLLSQEAKLL